MMLRKICLPKLEVFLRNVFKGKTGLTNWPMQSKDLMGHKILIRNLSKKDTTGGEEQKSKVQEYLKKAPSMQQRSREQIKELRDLRIELIKERKILQERLKENEKKIRQENTRTTPTENKAPSKYSYKLKMSRIAPKTKKVPDFRKNDAKVMQFQKFIENFGKSFPVDQTTGERSVQYNNLVETTLSKDQTPPIQPKSPNQGKNLPFDGNSFKKNAVGFAQRILNRENNNKTVAEASNKTSKDTPNTKSNSNVGPKDDGLHFKGHSKSEKFLKPDQVISTVTKKNRKSEAFEKARAERDRKLKESFKGKPETSHLGNNSDKTNVLTPIQTISAKNKEKPLSIPSESRIKMANPGKSKIETPIKLTPKVNAEKEEKKEKSVSKKSVKKKKSTHTVKVPIPVQPYDVLTEARRLQNPKKMKTDKKSISNDPEVNDTSPYSRLDLDPQTQFKDYIEKIQQQQTQFKKGLDQPTQASSQDVAKSCSQSGLDLEKCLANTKKSDQNKNSDVAMLKLIPNRGIESGELSTKINIPPKILEQLNYAEIRNQKFLIKEIKDQLKREFEVAQNLNTHTEKNQTETAKKEIDQKPIDGESGMEVTPKKITTETCVNDIEVSAKLFLQSLEQFVQSLKADSNNNNNNIRDGK